MFILTFLVQVLKKFPKVHWSRTSEHQESTDPDKFSTGPEYRNGGNQICWTQNELTPVVVTEWHIFKMTILGWQLNTWSDAAFHFVLGCQIINFRILVVPFNKALVLVFVVANSGYFTVFTSHIYFIILISMIAGNLVEIRIPKIHVQSRKCLWKFTFQRDKIAAVISLPFASTQRFFLSMMFEMYSSV